jgi:hypothetical protein
MTVTNVLVVPFEDGTFDLVLARSLKEQGDVVLEAEMVAKCLNPLMLNK